MWDDIAKGAVEGLVRGILSRKNAPGTSRSDVVEASHFVLRDAQDRGRAILTMLDGGPALLMLDPKEQVRSLLCVEGEASYLSLRGKDEAVKAIVMVDEDGPAVFFHDKEETHRVSLQLYDDAPALCYRDAAGRTRAVFTVDGDGPGLYDEDDNLTAKYPPDEPDA